MNYVRNAWYVAGWSVDLEDNKPFHIDILEEPIVIYRGDSGRLVALEDRCVHRLAALSLGRCEGDNLRCMYHGIKFAPDGKAIEIPGQDMIPEKAKVKSYPITDKHSWLWVWMGDPTLADEALIPPAIGLDDPDYILGYGFLDYDAEARLINDNLLDFSHLTYVHANSFGAGDEFALDPPIITQLERGIRFSRWVTNSSGGNSQASDELKDNWQSYDFLIPGILLMESATFPLGTAEKLNHEAPDLDKAISGRNFTSQAVTPTTAKGSRYFFNWGPHRDHGDEAMRDFFMELASMAFNEDKVMIESQQKVIDATKNPTNLAITNDRGVVMFDRLLKRLAGNA